VTFDLVVLGIVVFAALFGLFKGAARQIGSALGAVAAWFAAGPAGRFFGSTLAARLSTTLTIGTVLTTVAAFLLVYLTVQVISAAIIRRVLDGSDRKRAGTDRALGLVLGAAKMSAVVYVVLCGLTFFEQNVAIAGRKYTFTPKDSRAVALVRDYNLLEFEHFSGLADLVGVVKLQADPKAAAALRKHPDFAALAKDPRFKKALQAEGMKRALETGELRELLSDDAVVALILDPVALRRLERLVDH
jgi:uncharacterized membrane protein required for colicin V production